MLIQLINKGIRKKEEEEITACWSFQKGLSTEPNRKLVSSIEVQALNIPQKLIFSFFVLFPYLFLNFLISPTRTAIKPKGITTNLQLHQES